nr:MAG TPA: hypothetical protein [Caudoviricetes sp.]
MSTYKAMMKMRQCRRFALICSGEYSYPIV